MMMKSEIIVFDSLTGNKGRDKEKSHDLPFICTVCLVQKLPIKPYTLRFELQLHLEIRLLK
jgi:hypothetical protein